MRSTSPISGVARLVGFLLALSLVGGLLTAGLALPAVAGAGLLVRGATEWVRTTSTDAVHRAVPQTTVVTDSTGTPIAHVFEPEQNRRSVTHDEISPAMRAAIVAIEDRRFYEHNGVDWQAVVRALATNVLSGGIVQGASTITQQYVKNYELFVEADTEVERLRATEQTPARKLLPPPGSYRAS